MMMKKGKKISPSRILEERKGGRVRRNCALKKRKKRVNQRVFYYIHFSYFLKKKHVL